jgi:hypothetical protein
MFEYRCVCGKRLIVTHFPEGGAGACPACGRPLDAGAAGAGLGKRLAVLALLTLLFVGGLVGLMVLLLPDKERAVSEGPPPSPTTGAVPNLPHSDPENVKEAARTEPAVPDVSTVPLQPVTLPSGSPPLSPRPELGSFPLPPPAPAAVPPRGPGLQEGDVFWQEVLISRVSQYRVLGADLAQNVQYLLVSRFRVTKKEADGSLKVQQKVESVRLDAADRAMQAQLNDLLQKTRGATFELTLNPRREVVAFKGGPEALKVFTGKNPLGGQTFLLWSFLDLDGWKELAEVSFFRPQEPVRKGDRWARPMTHSWGPLGHWTGKVGFQHLGRQEGVERYDYALDLAYRPPAAGAGGGLPFEIGRSDFRIQTARGAIGFDPQRGRVVLAEERFHVRGALAVSALGVDTLVEMDEAQLFRLRLHDRNPLEK